MMNNFGALKKSRGHFVIIIFCSDCLLLSQMRNPNANTCGEGNCWLGGVISNDGFDPKITSQSGRQCLTLTTSLKTVA